MRAEEGAHDLEGLLLFQLFHRLQLAKLRLGIQAVAALSLYRGHAEGQHGLQPVHAALLELFQGGCPGLGDGGVDAAAPLHDGHVAVPAQPPGELIRTVAAEDEVGVGIHEAGQDGEAARVDDLDVRRDARDLPSAGVLSAPGAFCCLQPRQHFLCRADLFDGLVLNEDGAVPDEADVAHFGAALCLRSRAGRQFRRMYDQFPHGLLPFMTAAAGTFPLPCGRVKVLSFIFRMLP